MKTSKLTLPWGGTTVIGQVVRVLHAGGVGEIIVVTGGWRDAVEAALRDAPARTVFNPRYADGEMVHSLQAGMRALSSGAGAFLVALGDQPQIRAGTVRRVIAAFRETGNPLVVPSFRRRRGHPWLVARPLWPELANLEPPRTLRDFLNAHSDEVCYVDASGGHILQDMDTPEDYHRLLKSDG